MNILNKPRMRDVIHLCECLWRKQHVTTSPDKETCLYCGSFVYTKRCTDKDLRDYDDWQEWIKDEGINIENVKALNIRIRLEQELENDNGGMQ